MNNKILTSRTLAFASLVVFASGCMAQDGAAEDGATSRFDPVDGDVRRPDFTLTDMQGQSRTMDEWDGQVLLVDFWASWCVPCRHEMPYFNELREKYGDQGFEVIGVAADEVEKVDKFLAEVNADYRSGKILAGEIKQLCIDRACEWLTNHQQLRDQTGHLVNDFLAPDAR